MANACFEVKYLLARVLGVAINVNTEVAGAGTMPVKNPDGQVIVGRGSWLQETGRL